jgi:small conductance mechanosensitive channel
MQTFYADLAVNAADFLPNLLVSLLILVGSFYLSRLLVGLLRRAFDKKGVDQELTRVICQVATWIILVAGIISALQRFFDVTAFLAGLGILGFTVGFALQDIMKNFVAGVILLIQQPFKVGDMINVDKFDGIVQTINLRTTELRTRKGLIVLIPNSDMLSNTITNYTRSSLRRIDMPVGVAYNSDPNTTRQVILQAIRSIPTVLDDPAPAVLFHTFGESSIDLKVYFWIDTATIDYFEATDLAFTQIKAALDAHSIEIPFPIRTILTSTQLPTPLVENR